MADTYLQTDNKVRLLSIAEKRDIIKVLKSNCSKDAHAWYRECVFEKYRLVTLGGSEQLVTTDGKMVVSGLEVGNVIMAHHTALNHANEKETWSKLNEVYDHIPRRVVSEYVSKCLECSGNKQKECNENKQEDYQAFCQFAEFNFDNRGHIDIIEMPSDDTYNFVLHYTVINFKFSVLRPLKYNSISEVASTLMSIFHDFGAPDILQSHSRKFTSDILKELNTLHPEAFLVNGKYKEEHKKFSLAVKQKLVAWMSTNLCTKWTKGLSYIQWQTNNIIHEGFSKTPFELVFGKKPSFGAVSLKAKYKITASMLHEEEIKRLTDLPLSEETKSVVGVSSNKKTKQLSAFCDPKRRLSPCSKGEKNCKRSPQLLHSERTSTNNNLQLPNCQKTPDVISSSQEVIIPDNFIKQEVNSDTECTQNSFGNASKCVSNYSVKLEPNGSLVISEAYSLLTGEHAS